MADNDLDKYLEDLGINMAEDEAQESFVPEAVEVEESLTPASVPSLSQDGSAIERCESFLVNLLLNFDPSYAVEINSSNEERINVEIFGGDPGKIIGRAGKTLAALEYLTNSVINRQEGINMRVNIDVGGYKRRRDDRLRNEARRAASRVRRNGRPFEMEAMSAAERRVIHMALANDRYVMSESTGEGRDRRVVIKPQLQQQG